MPLIIIKPAESALDCHLDSTGGPKVLHLSDNRPRQKAGNPAIQQAAISQLCSAETKSESE